MDDWVVRWPGNIPMESMTDQDNLFRDMDIDPRPPVPKRKKRRKPEAKIQKEIVSWLLKKGVVLAITDAGILLRMGLNASCGVPMGWPDLTVCLPGGRFLGIEVKSKHGRQSDMQKSMQQKIEDQGGLYILVHSLAETKKKVIPYLLNVR